MINRPKVALLMAAIAAYVLAVVVCSVAGSRNFGSSTKPPWSAGTLDTYSGHYSMGHEVCTFRNEVIGDGAISVDRHCAVRH